MRLIALLFAGLVALAPSAVVPSIATAPTAQKEHPHAHAGNQHLGHTVRPNFAKAAVAEEVDDGEEEDMAYDYDGEGRGGKRHGQPLPSWILALPVAVVLIASAAMFAGFYMSA